MALQNLVDTRVCQLKPDYFVGIATDIGGNVHFLDESTILFPIGRVFLFHNLRTDTQHYMKLPETLKTITKIALSPNRKMIAVVEICVKSSISIFNLETRHRVIILGNPLPNCSSNTFEHVSFTCDNEHIVAVTGPPDWMMIYYNISGHVESYTKAMGDAPPPSASDITQLACNPADPTIVCIVGSGLFRFVSWTDNQWIQYGFNSADRLHITDVSWLTDEIVVMGTRCGRLVVVEYGDVRGVYRANSVLDIHVEKGPDGHRLNLESSSIPKGYKGDVYQIRNLTTFVSGFAYSYTKTLIVVFERTKPLTWTRRNVVHTVEQSKIIPQLKTDDLIKFISVSPDGRKLACTTGRKEIYFVDILVDQDLASGELKLCSKVLSGLHIGKIPSITAARWKPLLMTIGKTEGCCRIWNFKTKKVVLAQYFPDDKIYSCAFHPTGWYCLLGFKHQLKLFMVLVDELKPLRFFRIKMCSLVNFSKQGHMFAAGNSFRRLIEVYCSVSLTQIWAFRCYNDPVTAIHFGRNDNFVFTTDADGSINFWDLQTGEDVNTKIYLDTPNTDVVSSKNGDVFFVGADGYVKQIKNDTLQRYKIDQQNLNSIAIGNYEDCMFVGGEKCSILSIEFPINEPILSKEFKMHSSPILKILITDYDSTLITLDAAGIIGFWHIKAPADKRHHVDVNTPQLCEVVVNVRKLAEEDETIEKQQVNIDRKVYQHSYILDHLQDVKNKSLEGLTADFLNGIEDLKRCMKENDKVHSTQTSKYQLKFEELTKYYVGELEKQSKEFESDLLKEYLKSDALKGQNLVFINDVRKFVKTSKAATKQIFDLYTTFINLKIKEIKGETSELKFKKKSLLQKFNRETYYFEKFMNDCMDQYQEYHSKRLTKLKKRKEYLKDEILFLIKKSSSLEGKISTFHSSGVKIFKYLDEMRLDSRILQTKNKSLQMTLDAIEAQGRKKDAVIISIRKGLKSDVHEQMEKIERLEHLKLVLKPQIEGEIRQLGINEEKMHEQLLVQRSKMMSVGLCISAVERQIKVLLKRKSLKIVVETQMKKHLEEVKSDLNDTNNVSDNRTQLKTALVALYNKYINPTATAESIEENCEEGGLTVLMNRPLRPDPQTMEVEKTGLEDVVEFYQMEEMMKNGEESIRRQIETTRKALPRRPTFLVSNRLKNLVPSSRAINMAKEINSYRHRVADALNTLASDDRGDGCRC